MDIMHRIRLGGTDSSEASSSLTSRLKELIGKDQVGHAETCCRDLSNRIQTDGSPAFGQDRRADRIANEDSHLPAPLGDENPSSEDKNNQPATAPVAHARAGSGGEGLPAESTLGIRAADEGQPPAAVEGIAFGIVGEPEIARPGKALDFSVNAPGAASTESSGEKGLLRIPKWDGKSEEHEGGHRACADRGKPIPLGAIPDGPALSFLDQFKSAVNRAEVTGEATLAAVQRALADLQAARMEFETEIRDRLDRAIAEHEHRLVSEVLVPAAARQLEEKAKETTGKIFGEVKDQAWTVMSAVAGELRAFRDQFDKEVQARAGLLQQTTQQALAAKAELKEALSLATNILGSIPAAGQEAVAQVNDASADMTAQWHSAQEKLSQAIETQKNDLETVLQNCRQSEARLKEEIGKFRREAATSRELFAQSTEGALDRLNAAVDGSSTRARAGLEVLATEIEHRLLSGDLVKMATDRIESASREVVEPALERIRLASVNADSAADSLTRAGREIAARVDTARQEIESRLDGLMRDQQNMIESSMTGLLRNCGEEIGNLVARVVAQSSQQLDQRLRSLFDDLVNCTGEQINGVTRATLGTLHEGLKGIFAPPVSEPGAD